MLTFPELLTTWLTKTGYNNQTGAAALGIPYGTLRGYLSGKHKPDEFKKNALIAKIMLDLANH